MIDLTDRVALVTGGSRGIGRACALKLAEAGAHVIINYVSSRSSAMEVAERIDTYGRKAYLVKADVSEEDDVSSMMGTMTDECKQLVNTVGGDDGGHGLAIRLKRAQHSTFSSTAN